MKRNFVCPNCGKIASADESATGRRARCSQCREIFTLTASPPSPSNATTSVAKADSEQIASVSQRNFASNASVAKTSASSSNSVDALIADFEKTPVKSWTPAQTPANPPKPPTAASVSKAQIGVPSSVEKPNSAPMASVASKSAPRSPSGMTSPFASTADPFAPSNDSGDATAGGLLAGIDNFDAFAAAEQRRQALAPTNVPRGNNRPKPTPTNRRPAGAAPSAPRRGSRDETLLQHRKKALSAFLSCLFLGLIIGVVNLLLNVLIPGRLALGLSGAGTLFVFATSLRFFYYATRMLARMWGAIGILVGILNAILFPFYFMYVVYFIIAGRRGNGAPPVSAKKILTAVGILCGVLIGAPILLLVFNAIISVASTAADRAEVARRQKERQSAPITIKTPNPSNAQIDEIRNRIAFQPSARFNSNDASPNDDGFRSPAVKTPLADVGGLPQPDAAVVVGPDPATAQKKKPSDFKPLKYALDADGKIKIDALKSQHFRNSAQLNDANLDGYIDESEFGALFQACPTIAYVDHSEFAKSDFDAQEPGKTSPNAAPTGVSTVPTTPKTPEEIAAQKAERDASFDRTFNKSLRISEFVNGKPVEAKSVGDQGVPLEALQDAGFPEDIIAIYRQVDKNGDGFISHSEDGEAFRLKHEARVKKMRENH